MKKCTFSSHAQTKMLMLKRFMFLSMIVFIVLVLYSFVTTGYTFIRKAAQENNPPVVKIIAPKNNSLYQWNTPVQYKIKVSDQEDGESTFQEISPNEVFLQIKYLPDASKASAELNRQDKSEPAGFTAIKGSNCLNCHAFNGKLIGPSFYDISQRYPYTKPNLDLLAKRISEGSTGVWGTITMPTHPEITKKETQDIVQWILKNGADQNVNYYRGTEGYFTIKPPAGKEQKGVFVFTASYTDHGMKDKPKQNLTGQDVIIIQGR